MCKYYMQEQKDSGMLVNYFQPYLMIHFRESPINWAFQFQFLWTYVIVGN